MGVPPDLVADSDSDPAFAPAPGSSSSISSSRVDVLGSMVLGADTPTPSPVQPSRENGDGPPTPPLQPDQQSSSQLRLLRELRSSKEKNVSNLREMARLEDEVAALRRAKTEGGLRSGGGAELSTLLGIVHSEGKDKALAWAAERLKEEQEEEQEQGGGSGKPRSLMGFGGNVTFASPPPMAFPGVLSPITPREQGTMTDVGSGGTGQARRGRRVRTPHPRRRGGDAGDPSVPPPGGSAGGDGGAPPLPDRTHLGRAAGSVPSEFASDLATYYVRVPYVSGPGPTDAAWSNHGTEAPGAYHAGADAARPDTLEVMARIGSDGSVAVLHGECSLRHEPLGGGAAPREFPSVETMDGPLGAVIYIDVDGTEREYWLGKSIIEAVRSSQLRVRKGWSNQPADAI